MLKKRISMLVLVSLIVLPFLIAATEATTQIKTDNFVLEFKKPPYNKFFFSNPANTKEEYNAAKGVVFSFANLNQADLGYPSEAKFAITYHFESKGLFEVFANANLDHTSTFRLYASDAKAGLNYKIEIFKDNTDADAGKPVEATIDVDISATDAIYSVNIATPMNTDVSKVFKLSLRSKVNTSGTYDPYVEGQYKGYLIMQFTPSV